MTISYIDNVSGYGEVAGGTIATSSGLNAVAGNMIVVSVTNSTNPGQTVSQITDTAGNT